MFNTIAKLFMKKILFFICLIFATIAQAQNFSKSYSAVSCYNQMGMQDCPVGMVTYIDFYDNYIYVMGLGKCNYSGINMDGSLSYTPTVQGSPILRTIGIIISKDYRRMQEIQISSMMGMTMQIVYNYQWIGDGRHAAENMMGSTPDINYDEDYTCSSCNGSKRCKFCSGTGRYEYSRNGKCGVCKGTGKCQACNR